MLIITNRLLEEATSFTHAQIKRWSVAFLNVDEESGQHSGISRTYSFEQAVMIYFGGYLVRDLKFTLIEARQVLDDVGRWMTEQGWRIEKWVTFEQKKSIGKYIGITDFPWADLEISIGDGGQGRFFYDIKIVSLKKRLKGSDEWQETYQRKKIGSGDIRSIVPFRSVSVGSLVNDLAIRLAQRAGG
jgi:hypothetical protein